MRVPRNYRVIAIPLIVAGALTACKIHQQKNGAESKVDVQTPVGNLSAKANENIDSSDVGLPLYPGAQRIPEQNASSGAEANISAPFMHLGITAAKFQSEDPPDKILGFYRKKLAAYGKIEEGHGRNSHTQIQGFKWESTGDQTSLAASQGESHYIVMVQPHGSGSCFALMQIYAGGPSQPI
ncbi:MAG: hypothetical protein WCA16_03965 [Candidatus Sulfotelmatobacter sp.]